MQLDLFGGETMGGVKGRSEDTDVASEGGTVRTADAGNGLVLLDGVEGK